MLAPLRPFVVTSAIVIFAVTTTARSDTSGGCRLSDQVFIAHLHTLQDWNAIYAFVERNLPSCPDDGMHGEGYSDVIVHGLAKTPRSSCIRVIVKAHTSMSISSAKAVRFADPSREEPTMMRALLLLAAIPTVVNANEDVAAPSCVSPATVEPRAPRAYGGDRIVFTAGTDWQTGGQTLVQQYGLSSFGWPAENWNVSTDGVLVSPLTAQQIAQLRCDPVVERIVLGARTPESMAQERPRPRVRLGITFMYDQEGQPVKTGVVVVRVENGSVAETAGLRSKDRIVRFDEHDIVHGSDLLNVMAIKKPGNTVSMVVLRNGVETPLVAQF